MPRIAQGIAASILLATATAYGEGSYRLPSPTMAKIIDAPSLPAVTVSPDRKWLLLADRGEMPSVEDFEGDQSVTLAAFFTVDPGTNAPPPATVSTRTGFTLYSVTSKRGRTLTTPKKNLSDPLWSPDSNRFLFLHMSDNGVELWSGSVDGKQTHALTGPELNLGRYWGTGVPCMWMPDSRHAVCPTVPSGRGPPPTRQTLHRGPVTDNSQSGAGSPTRVFSGLLQDAHEEALYQYYMTAQYVLIDCESGQRELIGSPGIYESLKPSPDGRYLLAVRIVRPYSNLYTDSFFPKEVEIWSRRGEILLTLARLPMSGSVYSGVDGAPKGPRRFSWVPNLPDTVFYLEALDQGDPNRSAAYRDRIMLISPPFTATPVEAFRTRGRLSPYPSMTRWADDSGNLAWSRDGKAWVEELDTETHHKRIWIVDAERATAKQVFDFDINDAEANPGIPLLVTESGGEGVIYGAENAVLAQDGNWVFLSGQRASSEGDRPFLQRVNLSTQEREELFRSHGQSYERVLDVLDVKGPVLLTTRETQVDPPNYFIRDLEQGKIHAVTSISNPEPQLTQGAIQRVSYARHDGVPLSLLLHLPPGHVSGKAVPTVLLAYPLEYANPDTAGKPQGSLYRYMWRSYPKLELAVRLLVTEGYAVATNVSMPVIGGSTRNDTAAAQLVANAAAAVHKLVAMGVADRHAVGIVGHSYGAVMVATVLANSDLFAAGVGLSGAYNLTNTPFGFQTERRSFWEAPQAYTQLSGALHADRISAALLLIHGELDNNAGTTPNETRQMFQVLEGLGRTARVTVLPFEGHGYRARESNLHIAWEILTWFDKYVKRKEPTES